jgi:hypothetical protein
MKLRAALIVVAILGMTYTSLAQNITFGPRVGVNLASQKAVGGDAKDEREEFNETVKYNAGIQAGAVVNVAVNDLFSFQPELLFSQKGFKVKESEGGDSFELVRKASYLEVPVLAKFTFGTETLTGFSTMGPYAGYWMGGNESVKFNSTEMSEDIDFDKDDYNRLDVGASFGVGLAYKMGAGALNLDIRYNFGLSDVNKYDGNGRDGDPKLSNRVFGISLAYLFGAN